GGTADDVRGLEVVVGTAVAAAVAVLARAPGAARAAADRAGRALGIRGARRAGTRTGLGDVAVPGRCAAHRPRIPCRMLAVIAAAVALVAAARIAIVGAGGPAGLLRVGRTGGARPRAELGGIALAGRGAAERRGAEEGVGGTGGARAVAGLGPVAGPGRRPAHRPRGARGLLPTRRPSDALVAAARVAVVGAGRAARLLRVRRAVGAVAGTALRHVALAGGGATHDARGLEAVGGTAVADAVAGLGDVAGACRGTADRAGRALGIRGARGAGARARLGHVAGAGRRPAHGPRVARGVLAGGVRAVAGVGRAGVAVVGAGRAARLLRVGRAVGTVTGTALRHVTLAADGAADDARGLEAVGGAAVAHAVAGLGDVARARRGAADRARRLQLAVRVAAGAGRAVRRSLVALFAGGIHGTVAARSVREGRPRDVARRETRRGQRERDAQVVGLDDVLAVGERAAGIGQGEEDLVCVGQGVSLEEERDGLPRRPAGAGDDDGLPGRVVELVGGHRGRVRFGQTRRAQHGEDQRVHPRLQEPRRGVCPAALIHHAVFLAVRRVMRPAPAASSAARPESRADRAR